jgi:hypothetical protein
LLSSGFINYDTDPLHAKHQIGHYTLPWTWEERGTDVNLMFVHAASFAGSSKVPLLNLEVLVLLSASMKFVSLNKYDQALHKFLTIIGNVL